MYLLGLLSLRMSILTPGIRLVRHRRLCLWDMLRVDAELMLTTESNMPRFKEFWDYVLVYPLRWLLQVGSLLRG